MRAIFPGSFDPITIGHLDIIERAASKFDEVIIVILINPEKRFLFSMDERLSFIEMATEHLSNVKVDSFEGLTVDYCKENDVDFIIRGLRDTVDFQYEKQLEHINYLLNKEVESIFMMTKPEYFHISSSAVKELLSYNRDVSGMLPENVAKAIMKNKK